MAGGGQSVPEPAPLRRRMTVTPSAVTATFDWRQFFVLAERLAREVDEAALRSAISRAYYAVFALASRRLRDQGCWQSTRDPHTRVWATYRNARSPACVRIADHGFNLLVQRRRADYDDRRNSRPAGRHCSWSRPRNPRPPRWPRPRRLVLFAGCVHVWLQPAVRSDFLGAEHPADERPCEADPTLPPARSAGP